MNKNHPKISIVTPSYNQGQYLEQTILSIIGQNYPNLEYIIIDGGSTDNSVEIIKKYEKHLAYWVSEKDEGHYHAVQKGFEKSTGEIMTYLNSDDILHTNSLFTVAEILDQISQIKWLTGLYSHIDEQERIVSVGNWARWNKYRYYRKDYKFIQQEGTFWRRDLWERSGKMINQAYHLAADLELWLRFFQFADLYTINTVIGGFRIRKSNQRSLEMINEYCKQAEEIIGKHQLTKQEEKELARTELVENTLLKIPILKNLDWLLTRYYYSSLVFRFPPSIKFDRIQQKFVI